MKKNICLSVCIALCSFMMHSCNNWLDIQPTDRQTEAQTYSSKAGFYSVLNGIYTKLNDSYSYGEHLSYNMIEVMAKRYVIANTDNKIGSAFVSFNYTNEHAVNVITGIWETNYNIILNCNKVLYNAELKREMLGERDYAIIKGEMLALRAFVHFDLLRLFGPIYLINPDSKAIPYNNSCDGTVSPLLSAKEIIFDNILVDIENAKLLLEKYDAVLTDGPMAEDIKSDITIYSDENIYRYRQLRFNYFALMTLKARIELYVDDKMSALATAKSVINSDIIKQHFPSINSSLIIGNNTNPDRMFTSEAFFGLYNKERNLIYKNNFDPETAGDKLLQPRSGFIETILFLNMLADYRLRGQWIDSESATNTNRTLGKFKDIQNRLLFYSTFSPLVRLSELYLIAAESEPNVADGLRYLNILRTEMRGNIGSPVTGITTVAELDQEITKEYIREFYGEGQLFFYYKRKNMNIQGTNNGNSPATISIANSVRSYVLPLPESEITSR